MAIQKDEDIYMASTNKNLFDVFNVGRKCICVVDPVNKTNVPISSVTLAVRCTHLMLRQELVVGGQVGRSDRRRDAVLRRCFAARLRSCDQHGGDDVPAEPLGDEVHGRAAAVSVEHTVECLREIKRFGD